MTNIEILPGKCYLIKQILATGAETYRRKLLAMGLIPGASLRVKRIAPLGDPIQFEVNGFSLSLRREELKQCLRLELLDE